MEPSSTSSSSSSSSSSAELPTYGLSGVWQRRRALLYRGHARRRRDEHHGAAADFAASLAMCGEGAPSAGAGERPVAADIVAGADADAADEGDAGAFAAATRAELALLGQQEAAFRAREVRVARAMMEK